MHEYARIRRRPTPRVLLPHTVTVPCCISHAPQSFPSFLGKVGTCTWTFLIGRMQFRCSGKQHVTNTEILMVRRDGPLSIALVVKQMQLPMGSASGSTLEVAYARAKLYPSSAPDRVCRQDLKSRRPGDRIVRASCWCSYPCAPGKISMPRRRQRISVHAYMPRPSSDSISPSRPWGEFNGQWGEFNGPFLSGKGGICRQPPARQSRNMQTAPGSLRWRSPAVTSTAAPGEPSESPGDLHRRSRGTTRVPCAVCVRCAAPRGWLGLAPDSEPAGRGRAMQTCKGCRRPMRTAGNGLSLARLDRAGRVTAGKAGRRATGPNRTAGSGPPALASAAVRRRSGLAVRT
jgi:hypothetical protein